MSSFVADKIVMDGLTLVAKTSDEVFELAPIRRRR